MTRAPDPDEYQCVCGMAANDPTHGSWHPVLIHNAFIFATARAVAVADHDVRIADRERRNARPAVPQGGLGI